MIMHVAIVLISGALTGSALAGFIPNDLFPSVPSSVERTECPQLGGSWKGTCTDDDGTTEASTKIEQTNCEMFLIDGVEYRAGGMTTMGFTAAETSDDSSTALDWDGDNLRFKLLFNGRMIGQAMYWRGNATALMSLEGAQLVTKTEGEAIFEADRMGPPEPVKFQSECRYDKAE